LTNNPFADVNNDTNSGSLILQANPNSSDQIVFMGSFHNQWGYDFTDTANLYNYTNVPV